MIEVSGRSLGGISYAHRLLEEFNKKGGAPIEVKVTSGHYQFAVVAKIRRGEKSLREMIRISGGHPEILEVRIIME